MTARGTPSFVPPPTQNTAPVHEYRCMFSRDAHKKKKTFHDGTLKFHTFNSRVMVYDLDRRYIGDLHYRDGEDFGEGLELRLDRGLLVEVQDRLGETQTDLEQVLHPKNKESEAAKHTSPAPPRPLRLSAAASQQKPRSLKDVLGASQGQLARARVPLQSPYDQRHVLGSVQPLEPPPKRQKAAPTGKENVAVACTKQRHLKPVVASPLPKAQTALPVAQPTKDAGLDFQEVVDLSSDDDLQQTVKPRRSIPKATRTLTRTTAKEKLQSPCLVPQNYPSNMSSPAGATTAALPRHRSSTGGPVAAQPTRCAKPQGSRAERAKPTPQLARFQLASSGPEQTRLSMPSHKPRPRLMYRALLRPSMPPAKASATSPGTLRDSEAANDSALLPPPEQSTLQAKSLGRVLDELDDENYLAPSDIMENRHQPAAVFFQSEEPTPNPLFAPSAEQVVSKAPSQHPTQDSLDEHVLADPDHSEDLHLEAEVLSEPAEASSIDLSTKDDTCEERDGAAVLGINAPIKHMSKEAGSTSPKSSAMQMPPPLATHRPPAEQMTIPSPQRFRRVLSENDASFSQEVPDEDFLGLTTQVVARKPRVVIGASPSKLRRTTSDSAAVEREDDSPVDAMSPSLEVVETGPWTSMEAFLLFEWWPAGRDKPNFGDATMTNLDGGRYVSGFQGITTARDMLRDDVNVL